MNLQERARQSVLDGALHEFDEAVVRAELKALERMERKGFKFRSIEEARKYQNVRHTAARLQAMEVAATAAVTRRTA